MGKLDGKVAVITGGNGGIGLATAERFAAEGAHVVITGRRQEEIDKAVARIGHGAFGVRSDVAKLDDLDRLYAEVKAKHGRVDVLFANAGIFEPKPIAEVTEEHFDKQFNINVRGLFFTVQKALALMPEGGSIVLNGSVVGVKGFADHSVYSATKAAVRSFARTWTSDLKDRKIRVNVVSPGPIQTPGFDRMASNMGGAEQVKHGMAQMVPMGRMGEADEIAKAALFLASDDSSFITGIDLFVDGGIAQV